MNKSSIKTALLIVLILGVIVQTGRLWFEESSGHNFFSSFLSSRTRMPEERYKIEPESIMVNLGNFRFVKIDVDSPSEIKSTSDDHILQLIRSGKYTQELPMDWTELLDRKSVLYEYPFTIATSEFSKSFGESGGDFKSRVSGFDKLLIKPARSSGENTLIYVVDSTSEKMFAFELQKGVSDSLSGQIDILRAANRESVLNYISSLKNSLEFFTGNVFLPEWQETEYSYSKPYVTNPLEEAGDLEMSVQSFFNNPVGLLSASDPAGIPFVSDKEAVVKYYSDDGILEYTNYGAQNSSRSTFDAAYTAARNFLNRDSTLKNDVYMTGGIYENDEWRLFFDYSLDGIRVFCPPFEHAIEITIEGGIVSKYRRLVKRLDHSELYGQFEESFIAVLDRALSDASGSGSMDKIDDMQLGYDAAENGFCGMAWFIQKDGDWIRE